MNFWWNATLKCHDGAPPVLAGFHEGVEYNLGGNDDDEDFMKASGRSVEYDMGGDNDDEDKNIATIAEDIENELALQVSASVSEVAASLLGRVPPAVQRHFIASCDFRDRTRRNHCSD